MKTNAYLLSCLLGFLPAIALAQAPSPAVSAQIPACASANDANASLVGLNTGYIHRVANTWGYLHRASSTVTVRSARILTGNQFRAGFMKLEIFSHSTSSGRPGARLAGGVWQAPISVSRRWQGTNFDSSVLMQKGTSYWLVWTEVGQSVVPYEPRSGTTTNTRVELRRGSGAWNSMNDAAVKYRLYCGLLDDVGVTIFGAACKSLTGSLGTAFLNEPPAIPNSHFRIEATGLPTNAAALLVIGLDRNFRSVSLGSYGLTGCYLNADLVLLVPGKTGVGGVSATSAAGHVSFPIPIPPDPRFKGLLIAWQIAAVEAGAPQQIPMVFTNAIRTTLY